MPIVMPPPPFLPCGPDAYNLMRGQYDVTKRIDGAAFRKSFELDQKNRSNLPSRSGDRLKTGRSLSEGRLSTAGSAAQRLPSSGSAVSGSKVSQRSRKSIQSIVSRVVAEELGGVRTNVEGACKGPRYTAEDPMWKQFAPMAARDHVAQLLNHPLPTKGMDNAHNFHTRYTTSDGVSHRLPIPPKHIAIPVGLYTDTFAFNQDMKKACHHQRFARSTATSGCQTKANGGVHDQWFGLERHFNTDYDDQMVTAERMGLIRK